MECINELNDQHQRFKVATTLNDQLLECINDVQRTEFRSHHRDDRPTKEAVLQKFSSSNSATNPTSNFLKRGLRIPACWEDTQDFLSQ